VNSQIHWPNLSFTSANRIENKSSGAAAFDHEELAAWDLAFIGQPVL